MKEKQPDWAAFGRAVYDLHRNARDFFGNEWSIDMMPLYSGAGLAEYVSYDPKVHGEVDNADPGDDVWIWTQDTLDQEEGK